MPISVGEIGMCNCGIMGPLRLAGGGNGFLGPQGCHLSENIMRKVAFENCHFFTATETQIVEITLYGGIMGPFR